MACSGVGDFDPQPGLPLPPCPHQSSWQLLAVAVAGNRVVPAASRWLRAPLQPLLSSLCTTASPCTSLAGLLVSNEVLLLVFEQDAGVSARLSFGQELCDIG